MTSWHHARSALLAASTALPLLVALPAHAQETTVEGVDATPGAKAAVTGQMTVRDTGPLARDIELTYADAATGQQVKDYDVELTQELHILAVDAQLNELVHEHVRAADPEGRFAGQLQFPHAGTYHIYTDAVPSGLGQQVQRFDVSVGSGEGGAPATTAADVAAGPISSSDGAYTVELDASELRASAEGVMSLHVLKDGQPATDLAPYLGVAAHVVLIQADDLAYVHAHALAGDDASHADMGHGGHDMPAMAPAEGADHSAGHGGHEMAQEPGPMDTHAGGHGGSHDMGHDADANGAGDAIMGTPGTVPADLTVYVTPPAAGTYGMWIEFVGGTEVITVPFKIDVPAS
ncbi:MAG: hypothetical protein ACTHLT_14170 [Devosia sp.]